MKRWAGMLLAMMSACSGGDWYTRKGDGNFYGRRAGGVWVRGPWEEIRPSQDVDEVIDQLCPAIMKLPRASAGAYGQEYCGVIYSVNGVYYASYGSPLGKTILMYPETRKQCYSPRFVVDERGRTSIIADYHSHPWQPSPMSDRDLWSHSQRWLLRIQFDTACRVMKLIPYVGESRPGEVFAREGQRWKLVGYILPEDKPFGIVTKVEP
ncbi:hypothetical protein [Myxococcus xanthus]|uniref:hypothetical protein n=1 Tax=Myxococcus xanthus TaxID=34 RepID=UPI00112C676C|nr:hypothetical protein [Myxococcus xanthus]